MASTSKSSGNLVCMCSPKNATSSTMAAVAGSTPAIYSTSSVAGTTANPTHARSPTSATGSTSVANTTPSKRTNSNVALSTSVAGTTPVASDNNVATSPQRDVAGPVAGSTVLPTKISSGVKCKMCKLKPKFGFLRSQRSLEGSMSPGRATTNVKEAEAARAAQPRERRARSAERYEGMRVSERVTPAALPRQTSLQTPMMTSPQSHTPPAAPPPPMNLSAPPPPYEAVVGQAGLPPSYDEYLSLRSNEKRSSSPPPPWSLTNQAVATQTPQPAHTCTCEECKNIMRQLCRQGQRPPQPTPRQPLRVSLPPEPTTSRECTCSRCMPRPNSYNDTANVNTAVLISLDTTAAMHGVLTDGIAFCSLM